MKYSNLSKNLKTYRKKAGFTQKTLGEKILKSEISIRKYENGNTNIPPATLFDLCSALNVSSNTLLGDDKEKYFSENFDTDSPQSQINMALLTAHEFKTWGKSWKNEIEKIESNPKYLLNTILNYLENTEKYYSSVVVNMPNDNDSIVPCFTDEQISDIVKKITELVKYEIYKVSTEITSE